MSGDGRSPLSIRVARASRVAVILELLAGMFPPRTPAKMVQAKVDRVTEPPPLDESSEVAVKVTLKRK
jgi:hypothetical protein